VKSSAVLLKCVLTKQKNYTLKNTCSIVVVFEKYRVYVKDQFCERQCKNCYFWLNLFFLI